jgi:hypothetical protein
VLGEVKLDARGRRLRAALAAGVVPDKTPGLRLMHDWLDSYVAVSPGGPRPHDPALTTPSGRPSHRVTKPHEDRPPISSHSAGRRRAHGSPDGRKRWPSSRSEGPEERANLMTASCGIDLGHPTRSSSGTTSACRRSGL